MKLVNLTPHEITIYAPDGSKISIPPSGIIARVKTERQLVGQVNNIPIYRTVFGEPENLPDPQPNTVYIVSIIVLQATQNRPDLVAPDTTPEGAVRDSEGKIIGVKGLQVI